jgi:hypothetical protein
MLADGARVGQDGKLYVFGGHWDRILAAAVPVKHPSMTIVLLVRLEYTEALENHTIDLLLRDQDGRELRKMSASLRVGYPPGLERGSPMTVPVVVDQPFVEFPVFGRFEWVIQGDGEELDRLPITIVRAQPTQGLLIPGGGLVPSPPQPGGAQETGPQET